MHLPVLHLMVPSVPCAVTVNGTLCGASADTPVMPVSPNGTVFITCLPIATDGKPLYLPHTVCLSFQDGLPNAPVSGCRLFLYGSGAIDVELLPQPLPVEREEFSSYNTSRALFTYQGHSHAATLYHDGLWRLAIEETGHDMLLVCHSIRDFLEGKVQSVHCFTPSDILVSGRGSHGPRSLLFSPSNGKFALVADVDAQSVVENRTLLCTQPLCDAAGHEKRFSIQLQNGNPVPSEPAYGHFTAKPEPLGSAGLVCKALCEAVALSLEGEALNYLAPELRDGMAFSDLLEFFGPFEIVYGVEGEGPYSVWLAYPSFDNVYRLQGFVFETEGLLLANIEPLD
jgi:hypothetical protein